MKKALLIVVIILAVVIALPVINLIRWTFQTKKPLDIILVDKTVPNPNREKHKSFNWILTNERFVKKETRSSYSYIKDYYGFTPKISLREKLWDRNDYHLKDIIGLAEKNDAIYFADTYGVFFNDWYAGINRSRKSRILYGGLNNTDFLLIKEMKDRNKLIIMEYNSFDYPTAQFESYRTQEKLGITFSGWTGKYFSTLDTTGKDFPIWMTAMYRKQYRKPWTYKKPGIVLLKEKYIIVLEEGTQLKNAMPHIITDTVSCKKYGVSASVAFDKWFDIIDPLQNNVVSKFKIETTSIGDTLLSDNNLISEFPAVIQEPAAHRIYYFSGDFANYNIPYWTSRFMGGFKFKAFLYSDKPDDARRFFWLYYKPLVNGIFTEYYNTIHKN
jgi:hypothetical protein